MYGPSEGVMIESASEDEAVRTKVYAVSTGTVAAGVHSLADKSNVPIRAYTTRSQVKSITDAGVKIEVIGVNNNNGTYELESNRALWYYNQSGQKEGHIAEIRVTDGDYELKEGVDYVLENVVNSNPGNYGYHIIGIKGIGAYTRSTSVMINVLRNDLSDAVVRFPDNITDKTQVPTPPSAVLWHDEIADDILLTKDTDYTVSYDKTSGFTAEDTVEVTITGNNVHYINKTTATYQVEAAPKTELTNVTINSPTENVSQPYLPGRIIPEQRPNKVYVNGTELTTDDYTYTFQYAFYNYDINAYRICADIEAKEGSGYTGKKRVTYTMTVIDFSDVNSGAGIDAIESVSYIPNTKCTGPAKIKAYARINEKTYYFTKDTDYTVSYSGTVENGKLGGIDENGNLCVGKITVTVKGRRYCKGEMTATYEVTRKSLKTGTTVSNYTNIYYYPGMEVVAPTVSNSGTTLKEGTDYTVTYNKTKGFKAYDKVTATISGMGNYGGDYTKSYTIHELDIESNENVTLTADPDVEYKAGMGLLKPTIAYQDILLTEGVDYTLSAYRDENCENEYTGSFQKGTVYVEVNGMGSCTGQVVYSYKITGPNLRNAVVTFAEDVVEYHPNLSAQMPSSVEHNGNKLEISNDYTVTVEPGYKSAGTVTETLEGNNTYSGEKQATYEIAPAEIDSSESIKRSFTLNDKEIELVVNHPQNTEDVVKDGEEPKEKSDFEIVYSPGNTEYPQFSLTQDYSYYDDKVNATLNKTYVLNKDTDYRETVAADLKREDGVLNVGKIEYAITGLGNYNGRLVYVGEVVPVSLESIGSKDSGFTVNMPSSVVYTPSLTVQVPEITYKDGDASETLKPGTDYEYRAAYQLDGSTEYYDEKYLNLSTYTPAVGKVQIIVTGKGNYTGEITLAYDVKPYEITDADLKKDEGDAKLSITMPKITYDPAREKLPTPTSVSYNHDGKNVGFEVSDYTVSYNGGFKAGTHSANITFGGNYEGTVEFSFTINPKALDREMFEFDESSVVVSFDSNKNQIRKCTNAEYHNESLVEGTDYTATISGAVSPNKTKCEPGNFGRVFVTYTGKAGSNYTGYCVFSYEVKAPAFTSVEVNGNSKLNHDSGVDYIYIENAGGLNNDFLKPALTYDDVTLTEGTHYTVTEDAGNKDNHTAGVRKITITGSKEYFGCNPDTKEPYTITYQYEVRKNPTDKIRFTWANTAHIYKKGVSAYDTVNVTNRGKTLDDSNYTLTFDAKRTDGKACVVDGSLQAGTTVSATLELNADYDTIANNTIEYTIKAQALDGAACITNVSTDEVRKNDAKPYSVVTQNLKAYDKDGNLLNKGTDYEVILPQADYDLPGEKVITVKGCGNYKGELTVSYIVRGTDPAVKTGTHEYDITLVKGGNVILDELKGATLVKYVLPDGTSTIRSNKYATFTARTGTVKALQAVNDFRIIAKKDGEEYVLNVKITAPYFALNDTEKYTVANKNAYVSMDYGKTANLGFTGTDLDISYTSENPDYLTVDRNGNVATTDIVAPPGTRVKITAMANGVKYTMPVVINVPKFTAKSYTVNAKNTENHNNALSDVNEIADVMNEAGYDVTYISSAPSVADVDADGKITGLSVGNATVTAKVVAKVKTSAKSVQPATYTDKTYTYTAKVTVVDPQIATNIKGTTYDAATGVLSISEDTQTSLNVVSINATGKRTVTTTLLGTWTTENDNIAHLNTSKNKWTVTGQKPDGSTVIRANVNGRVLEQTVKVVPKYNPAIKLSDAYKMSARTTTINLSSAVSKGAKFSQWEVVEGNSIASITTIRGKQYLSLNPNMTGTIKVRLTNFSAHMQNKRIVEKSIVISKRLLASETIKNVKYNDNHEIISMTVSGVAYEGSAIGNNFNITHTDGYGRYNSRLSRCYVVRKFVITGKDPEEFYGSNTKVSAQW